MEHIYITHTQNPHTKHVYKEINKINDSSGETEEYKRNAGKKDVRSDGNNE
jgi:hypothetical protein